MRWLLGLVTVVSMLLGTLGFMVSGTSGRRMDMMKGFVFGGIPAAIGLFVLYRLVFADKVRISDRIAFAIACYPIAFLLFGLIVNAVRGPQPSPGAALKVRRNQLETRPVDSVGQEPDTSSATAAPPMTGG